MRVRNYVASVLLAGSLTPSLHADSIWIEGEAAAEHNFASAGSETYAPQAFWEADALSGGDWLSVKWTDQAAQPYAVYEIEAPAAGEYAFYVRKFANFGAFRWKIDKGDWQTIPYTGQTIIDTTPFRETDERVYASWSYVGKVRLQAGGNTLRIEPYFRPRGQDPDHHPLAYDVLLFTQDVFFPRGKLQPDEHHGIQTRREFSFEPPADEFDDNVFARHFDTTVAAAPLPRVRAEGKGFVLGDEGTPFKAFALNATFDLLAHRDGVRYLSRFIARRGFNTLRLPVEQVFTLETSAPGVPRFELNPKRAGDLAFAIAEMERNGIYTALNWNVSTTEGVREYAYGKPSPPHTGPDNLIISASHLLVFDPEFRAAFYKAWQTLLSQTLKSGDSIGQSPAVAFLTLGQQISVLSANAFTPVEKPESATERIEHAFANWVIEKYGSLDALPTGWAALPRDDAGDERLEVLAPDQWADTSPRSLDTVQFLAETQRAFYEEAVARVKDDFGYQGLVATSNKSTSYVGRIAYLNKWTQAPGDFYEVLANVRPYFEMNYGPWIISENVRFENRSLARLDPRRGDEAQPWNLPLKAYRYADKPLFISEFTWARPNRYRSEMMLIASALAAQQGAAGIGYSSVATHNWQGSLASARTVAFSPATVGQAPAASLAFQQSPTEVAPVAGLNINTDELFSGNNPPLFEAIDSQITAPEQAFDTFETDPELERLWTTGAVDIRFSDAPTELKLLDTPATNSNPMRLDWQTDRGLFIVDSPRIQGVTGFLGLNSEIELADVTIDSPLEFGSVIVLALDGKPLDFSEKIFVQLMSEESNTAWYATGGDIQTIRSIGTAPVLVKNIEGRVGLNRPDADQFIATALDANGNRQITAGVGSELYFLPTTLYYLLEKKK